MSLINLVILQFKKKSVTFQFISYLNVINNISPATERIAIKAMKNNLILKYEFYLHIFTDVCKASGSDNSPQHPSQTDFYAIARKISQYRMDT